MSRAVMIAMAVALGLAVTACASGSRGAYAPASAEAQAIRVESLLAADRAFAERAREVGAAAAFADFMAADGKLLGAAAEPVVGSEAIFSVMSALPENADISWTPREAMVSASGDFGVTWGDYRLVMPTSNGEALEETGRYLTVWRKDERGRWRGVLDIGT